MIKLFLHRPKKKQGDPLKNITFHDAVFLWISLNRTPRKLGDYSLHWINKKEAQLTDRRYVYYFLHDKTEINVWKMKRLDTVKTFVTQFTPAQVADEYKRWKA